VYKCMYVCVCVCVYACVCVCMCVYSCINIHLQHLPRICKRVFAYMRMYILTQLVRTHTTVNLKSRKNLLQRTKKYIEFVPQDFLKIVE